MSAFLTVAAFICARLSFHVFGYSTSIGISLRSLWFSVCAAGSPILFDEIIGTSFVEVFSVPVQLKNSEYVKWRPDFLLQLKK